MPLSIRDSYSAFSGKTPLPSHSEQTTLPVSWHSRHMKNPPLPPRQVAHSICFRPSQRGHRVLFIIDPSAARSHRDAME